MDKRTEEKLRRFVVGFEGMASDVRNALIKLSQASEDRQSVYLAAMRGRDAMYHYQYGDAGIRRALSGVYATGDYWRSVGEAIEIANGSQNSTEDKRWFLDPIQNTKPESASPITLAEMMEPA